MAIAGLHNLSPLDSSFFRDSQPPASSILRMWRELESDQVASHSHRERNVSDNEEGLITSTLERQISHNDSEDADETKNQGVSGLETEHDDNGSIISEQSSSDLGEIERERVRQVFREWMNCGGSKGDGFHLNSRNGPHWLGENECERVRIIRDWMQNNAQQRNNNQGGVRDEAGSQIEQVRDGLVVTQPEVGPRRPIRKLCGRQTLLDLIERAQCERKSELQCLLEHRPVTDFAHRNRIQAFLRGRFLRNERSIPEKRPGSVASTELGLLRKRQTVSGLREGFLSNLDNTASTSVNDAECNGESESSRAREMTGFNSASVLESGGYQNRDQQELVILVTEENQCEMPLDNEGNVQEVSLDNDENEQEVSLDNNENAQEVSLDNDENEQEVSLDNDENAQVVSLDNGENEQEISGMSLDVGSAHSREERILDSETTEQELSTEETNTTTINELPSEIEDINPSGPHEVVSNEHYEETNTTAINELPSEIEDINPSGPHEVVSNEHYESRSGARYVDIDANDRFDLHAQVDEFQESSVTEIEDNSWQQLPNVAFTEWVDDRSWQETSANQGFEETSYNEVVEQDQMQEPHEDWPSHDLQEAINSWLHMPSGEVGASGRSVHAFYFPDDDTAQGMEIRELFSRRRVSSLLRSSFRESLDQVLQSHMERQGNASGDWEMDNESSLHSLVEEDRGQQNGDQVVDLSDDAAFAPISALAAEWNEELRGTSFPHSSSDQLGTEWEVINELRIDMARLQQRMNSMQSMLEQCTEMQIELQRSVRQEVSAALNRSILTRDGSKGIRFHEDCQWDYVKKGICCICCDSKIDSLLYRCGHMCTCSSCAEKLVQGAGKCPMCQAPIVEAVRAYFIQ